MRHSIPTRAALRLSSALLALLLGSGAVGGPVGEEVVHGSASIQRDGALTTIRAADRTIINYRSFDVAGRETVQFIQPAATARVLNRIQSATPTQIDGTLRANGIVYFVNPAGVRFGQGAVVDVGQIYAAAGSISNRDFLDGISRFTGLQGDVANWGTIRGDVVGLVGRHVGNYGSIVAESGLVAMVAGDEVTLTRLGSQMMVKVSGGGGETAGVENAGEVSAPRGSAVLGAGDMYSLAVKNVGMVKAKSVVVQGRAADGAGQLEADELTLSGTALADEIVLSVDGGRIAIGINGSTLLASAPQQLTVNTGGGDDSLTVDFSGGNPIPAGGLVYDGQGQDTAAGDALTMVGGSFQQVAYVFTGASDGAITLDGASLTFAGLEPIIDTVVAAQLDIFATAAADTINIVDGAGSGGFTTTEVNDGGTAAFESVEFANKTTVTVNGLGGGDTFTVNNPNPADGLTTLELQGGDDPDTVTILALASPGSPLASATVNAETIAFQAPLNATAMAGTTNAVTISASGVTLSGFTLNGAGNSTTVTIDSQGGAIDNTTISNNTFNLASGDVGIWVGGPAPSGAITNTTISGNTFNGPGDMISNPLRIGGWFGSTLDVAVTGFTFSGNTVDRGSIPIFLHDENLANLTFQGNLFTNTDGVLYIWDNAAATPTGELSGFVFTENDVSDTGGSTHSYGVGIDVFGVFTDANFGAGNEVTDSRFAGVGSLAVPAGTFHAVSVLSPTVTEVLEATGNWWGTNSAAGVAAVADGPVNYSSWLNSGTDSDPGPGFSGDFSALHVSAASPGTGLIQDAIDLVDPGGTVNVGAGSYVEDLTVGKAVTIQGAGAATTTLTNTTSTPPHVINTSGVTFDGFTFDEALAGTGETFFVIDSSAGVIDNTTFTNNIFNLGTGDVGIWVGGSAPAFAITNTTVSDNIFNGPGDMISNPLRIGGWFGSTLDVAVTGLTFSGNTVDRGSIPVFLHDEDLTTLAFQGNTFTNTDGVLYIWDNGGASPTGVLAGFDFSGNGVDATNSYGVGIDLFDTYTDANFGAGNQITANDFVGIPGAYGFGAVSILSTGLTTYVLDAEDNWWGTASGPTHGSNVYNVGSQGSPVSDNVDYFAWLDGPFATGSSFAPVTNTTQGTDHPSIQDAIGNAVASDTIVAAAGAFSEDLTVNVPDLTLESQSGSGSTTLQLVGGVGIDIPSAGSGLTFGGTGVGFEVLGGGTTTFLVSLNGGPTDVTIADSTFNTSGSATVGIDIDGSGTSGFTFSDSTIAAPDVADTGIRGGPIVDLQITGSTFTGPGALPAAGSTGIDLSGVTASGLPTSTVSGTTISNFDVGILTATGTGTANFTFDSLDISGCNTGIDLTGGGAGTFTLTTITNTTLNANGIGVRVRDGVDMEPDTFTIQNLTVTGNTTGVLHEHTTDTLTVSQSDFSGNTTAVSAPGAAVTAENNWWDSANGPTHGTNTFNVGSQGQPVTGTIDFTRWLDAPVATGNPFAPVTNITQTTYHPSIQDAIDSAADGDRLRAVDGVFTEDLVVDVANLILESTTGLGTTTIQFVNGTGVGIDVQADGFLLGGPTGSGFTLLGGGTTDTLVQFTGARTLTEIAHNALDTTGNATVAINLGTGATEVYVNDNTFALPDVGDSGVVGSTIVDLEVLYNTFTGSGPMAAGGDALRLDGLTGTVPTYPRINDNTISNFDTGIQIGAGTGTTGLDITSNGVSGCTTGIDLLNTGTGAFTLATISDNDITGNTTGISIADGANLQPSTFTIEFNNISGNTTGLASAHTAETTDASLNWWGDPTGPVHASNPHPAPAGDPVTGDVTVLPYLATATVTPFNIAISTTDDFGGAGELLFAWSDTFAGAVAAAIASNNNAITPTFDGPGGGNGAATYTETAVLNKPGLILRSDPLDTITLEPAAGAAVSIEADSCTVGGAAGEGFTINSTPGAGTLIDVVGAPSAPTISYNTFDTASAATIGIGLGTGTAGATIMNNAFTCEGGDTCIAGINATNLGVTANTFTGPGTGLDLAGTATALIEGNTFTSLGTGLLISNGGGSDQVTINLNTFDTCGIGIHFAESPAGPQGDLTNAEVTRNLFDGCGTGLQLDNSTRLPAGSFLIQNNAFQNSTTWNLDSAATAILDAAGNWWGTDVAATIPTTLRSVANGGNGIDYSPWLATDTNSAAGPGFVGDFALLHINLASPQVNPVSALQEGNDAVVGPGTTVFVEPGTYGGPFTSTVDFTFDFLGAATIDTTVTLGSIVAFTGGFPLTFNDPILGAADGVGGLRVDVGAADLTFTDQIGLAGQRLDHARIRTTGNIALNTTGGNPTFTVHTLGGSVELGSDLAAVPEVATIWSEGPGGGNLDIRSDFGHVLFGRNHKVTSVGDPIDPFAGGTLVIIAPNGTITGTDFSARQIGFLSSQNRFYGRPESLVRNADGNLELDFGADVVGLDGVTLIGGNTFLGGGLLTTVAANAAGTIFGANGLQVGTLSPGEVQAFYDDTPPPTVRLDLQAEPGARELSTVFASAIPRVEDVEVEPEEVELSPAMIELLEQIGIFARKAQPGEGTLFDDLIAKPPSERRPEDHRVAAPRLDPELVERAVATYRAIYWKDGKYQAATIKDTLRKALAHCKKIHKDRKEFDPVAFRRCLETEAVCREALKIVDQFRELFGFVNVLGLSGIEVRISERILTRDIVFRGLTGQQVIDTIKADTAASRPAAP